MAAPRSRQLARPAIIAGLVASLAAGSVIAKGVAITGADAQAAPENAGTQVDAAIPDIDWQSCDDGLRCATVAVPLDYDAPTGQTTELALAQRPAEDQDARIGTLFVNPGGPGESAVEHMAWFVENLPPGVLERFDIVGVDPRGIGGSSALRCRGQDGDGIAQPQWAFPLTPRQTRESLRYDSYVRRSCDTAANPIIDHMTTADTARDMDLIRQAVGDEQLSYYGISYGSYLGATYAAMFPDRIRAMAVDGVIDPIAYAIGHDDEHPSEPVTARWNSAKGAWASLTAAFAECDRVGPARCPIAGESTATWQRIVNRLERGPVEIDGEQLTYQDVIATAEAALRDVTAYHSLMHFLDETDDQMFGGPHERERADVTSAYTHLRRQVADSEFGRGQNSRNELAPVTEGVICADSVNPTDPRAWIAASEREHRRAPWFGRLWTWRSSSCAQWPGSSDDAFRGPFQADTSAPALLVANLHDPATPISGARTLNTLLADSRMLTVDGWGHGMLGESTCVEAHVEAYLVSGTLPPAGTVCDQDDVPYPDPS